MSAGRLNLLAIVAVIVVMVISSSVYIVNERERAVLLKFGEVVDSDVEPGLHFKLPIVNDVKRFEARLMTLDARPQRYLTAEKKGLIVDSYVKWRVADTGRYYTATGGDELEANRLLSSRADNGLRNKFGERTVREVVSGERDELMAEITKELNSIARTELGIEILDVRVKAVDLPPEVSNAVYSRMASEREREARELRSEGREAAEGIEADADRQKTIIEAEAYRTAQATRGEGDASAAQIYAEAFNLDKEFYAFYRSMSAYRSSFANKDDMLVLEPDSDFFRFLKNPSPDQ
ncbi:protease modulator HflC [Litorivicinus lipolyticus]|jgi:modulator of FtsH protease HflC|uniref:protease modulator HflC n=1 Tax=Litorivicinus lipolyticus TaxID=418701 RepID=UPI003B5A045D